MNVHRIVSVCLCFLVLSFMAVGQAKAQWVLGAGGVFVSSPYKEYDRWTPMPIIAYRGKYVYIRGTQVGAQFSPMQDITVGAFVEYDFTNFFAHRSDNAALQHLDDRYGSLLGGVVVTGRMPFGGTLRASLATNMFATHTGMVGTLEYDYMIRTKNFMVTPFVGVKAYSREYVDYYYGVTGTEALRSGLQKYEADAMSLEPYVGVRASYMFTENISLMLGGSVRLLSQQVLDSPMVDNEKSVTYSVFGGLLYTF